VDQWIDGGGAIDDAHDVKIGFTNGSGFAYVADGRNGLRVVQIISANDTPGAYGFSPRPTPKLVATYATRGPALALSVDSTATGRWRRPATSCPFSAAVGRGPSTAGSSKGSSRQHPRSTPSGDASSAACSAGWCCSFGDRSPAGRCLWRGHGGRRHAPAGGYRARPHNHPQGMEAGFEAASVVAGTAASYNWLRSFWTSSNARRACWSRSPDSEASLKIASCCGP